MLKKCGNFACNEFLAGGHHRRRLIGENSAMTLAIIAALTVILVLATALPLSCSTKVLLFDEPCFFIPCAMGLASR
jgi:hypothetical protein